MAASAVISDLSPYPPISQLLLKHPTLSPHVQFLSAGQLSGAECSARLAKQLKQLRRLLTFVDSQLSQVHVSLAEAGALPVPVSEFCYDDLRHLMRLRILTFLRREAQHHHSDFHAGCFKAVRDHRESVMGLVDFLASGSLPLGLICDIDLRGLSVTKFPAETALHSAAVERLERAIRRISDEVAKFPRAPWSGDFGRFSASFLRARTSGRAPTAPTSTRWTKRTRLAATSSTPGREWARRSMVSCGRSLRPRPKFSPQNF
jgi:hypothetical protein